MKSDFAGFVSVGSTAIRVLVLFTDSSETPTNASALPTYRVYGPSGVMQNGTGTTSFAETGTITNATNANPIVITSAAHGLTTGTRVTITGVGGNTAANTTAVMTKVDANTFSIAVAGNGAYTNGGTWNTSGLYKVDVTPLAADGYVAETLYNVLFQGTVTVNKGLVKSFICV